MELFSAFLVLCEVRGIHRSAVDSPHKGQWRGASKFSLICAWTNGWANNTNAGDFRRYRAHYDVTMMIFSSFIFIYSTAAFCLFTALEVLFIMCDIFSWCHINLYYFAICQNINSSAPGKCVSNFESIIFEMIIQNNSRGIRGRNSLLYIANSTTWWGMFSRENVISQDVTLRACHMN